MRKTVETPIIARQTKYCRTIEDILRSKSHATNAELLDALQLIFPGVSATTVHRATARLASRGVIAVAPVSIDGDMRYDANLKPHDHFQCSSCGVLRDTNIKDKITPILEASIDGCQINGRLTINGVCKLCAKGNNR